ncbi:MAG TPA: NAD(P)H-binding protein, partial [Thermoplasmata archaeon]|nr:NAD(P)H-binding protein [Thermoplasmata archaeon]
MRILVAGATGVLGAPTVRALVGAGHEVVGLARSPEKAKAVEALGGIGAIGDILKPATLGPATRGADAVVHLASSTDAFEAVRVEGCRNLVVAAQASGVRRFVVG